MSDVGDLRHQMIVVQDRAEECRFLDRRLAPFAARARQVSEPIRALHTSAVWTGGAAELSRYWLSTVEHRLLLLERELTDLRVTLRFTALRMEREAQQLVQAIEVAEAETS